MSKFMDVVRDTIRAKQYSSRTEQTYLYWIRYFIRFQKYQHPKDMGDEHIRHFLNFLALQKKVTANTQKVALNALVFMYRHVLSYELGDFSDFYRARSPKKLPTVLTHQEITLLFQNLNGTPKLCAALMYGSGLRLMETMRLRVHDIDFNQLTLSIREGKGRKSRLTTLAPNLIEPLKKQVRLVNNIF